MQEVELKATESGCMRTTSESPFMMTRSTRNRLAGSTLNAPGSSADCVSVLSSAAKQSRISKRPNKDETFLSPSRKIAKSDDCKKDGKACSTPEIKARKQFGLWDAKDINNFFKALSEFGRDFDAVQKYLNQKKKKGAENEVKTKEQVRYFYYRTWHKISKFITQSPGLEKHILELSALINYGEFRKRAGSKMDPKNGKKLNELVHKGFTFMKIRGKNNYRIKTPQCKALRRLNNVEDESSDRDKLPDVITVELMPRSNAAWAQVQQLSQNPRLRLVVKCEQRLSSLMTFLNKKWQSNNDFLRKQYGLSVGLCQSVLKLYSQSNGSASLPFPNNSRVNRSLNLQLGGNTGASAAGTVDPGIIKVPSEDVCIDIPDDARMELSSEDSNGSFGDNDCAASAAKDDLFTDLKLDDLTDNGRNLVVPTSDHMYLNDKNSSIVDATSNNRTSGVKAAQHVRDNMHLLSSGIALSDADKFTVGALYTILGDKGKLLLEYDWHSLSSQLLSAAVPDTGCLVTSASAQSNNVTNMLRRLIHLAVLELSEHKLKQRQLMVTVNAGTAMSPQRCVCGRTTGGDGGSVNELAATGAYSHVNHTSRSALTDKKCRTSRVKQVGVPDGCAEQLVGERGGSDGAGAAGAALGTSGSGLASLVQHRSVDLPAPVFKVPTIAPAPFRPDSVPQPSQQDILEHIKALGGRRGKRLSRPVIKPLVVQRTLLPKAQIPDRQLMSLTMVPASFAQTATFLPIVATASPQQQATAFSPQPNSPLSFVGDGQTIQQQLSGVQQVAISEPVICAPVSTNLLRLAASEAQISSDHLTADDLSNGQLLQNNGNQRLLNSIDNLFGSELDGSSLLPDSSSRCDLPSRPASPALSISALLDISLPVPPSEVGESSSDRLLNFSLDPNTSASVTSFAGLLNLPSSTNDTGALLADCIDKRVSTSSKLNEESWLAGEDFSLSQLFNSPCKQRDLPAGRPNHAMPSAMDSLSLINENSLDYAAKFAELAEELAENTGHKKTQ